jgi:hypothetical protein
MNKKLLLLTLLLFVCVSLIACFPIDNLGHECIYSEWQTVKEATCQAAGKEARSCTICGNTESRQTARAEHVPVEFAGKEAGCMKGGLTAGIYCEICNGIITGVENIPALGHTEVIDPAVEPTDNKPGRTEGKHCSTCGEVFIKQQSIFSGDYSDSNRYHDDYAYLSLAGLKNGKNMQDFYNEIDAVANDFHNSLNDAKVKESGKNTTYYLAEFVYSDNNISSDDAFAVWSAYMKDHPLYYWLSKQIKYTDDYITVMVDSEYVDGATVHPYPFENAVAKLQHLGHRTANDIIVLTAFFEDLHKPDIVPERIDVERRFRAHAEFLFEIALPFLDLTDKCLARRNIAIGLQVPTAHDEPFAFRNELFNFLEEFGVVLFYKFV